MKIAITGHRGFIGSHMARRLSFLGHSVIEVVGDVRVVDLPVADGFMHFASKMGGVGFFSSQQFDPILDNLLMDARIIQHCQRHGTKLLYPSSACAYPVKSMEEGVLLGEDLLSMPAEPDQMYGMEKLFITRLSEHADFDLRVPILHTIYGEGQDYLGDRAKFPPQICHKFASPETIEVWGDGSQTRTFLHIEDAVEMLLEVFFNDDYYGPVNVSHPDEVSIREVVEILANQSGRLDVSYNSTKPTGPMRRSVDNTKFNSHYKSRPKIGIAEGFARLYEDVVTRMKTVG